jgi:hypothetical protein
MPRSREEIIAGIQEVVDKYPDVTTNPLRLNPTTGGEPPMLQKITPVPMKKRKPTFIPPNLGVEDRKFLQSMLEE